MEGGWIVPEGVIPLARSTTFPHPKERTRGSNEVKSACVVKLSLEQLLSIACVQVPPSSTVPVSELPHVDLCCGSLTLKDAFSHRTGSQFGKLKRLYGPFYWTPLLRSMTESPSIHIFRRQ